DEAISPGERQAEAEAVEGRAAVEEEGEGAAKFSDEELEAQALAGEAAEEAVVHVAAGEEDAPVQAIVQEQE
ncbi:signal recognition particle-docking protein FtsY, partial [Salmonella enterica]